MGKASSKSASSPPTIMVKVPFLAPISPPEIGASRNRNPWDWSLRLISWAAWGPMVLKSTIRVLGRAWAAMPSVPKITD